MVPTDDSEPGRGSDELPAAQPDILQIGARHPVARLAKVQHITQLARLEGGKQAGIRRGNPLVKLEILQFFN